MSDIGEFPGEINLAFVEDLYAEYLREALSPYLGAEACCVQEEPLDMGAWRYLQMRFPGVFSRVVSRPESARPATGSMGSHKREQRELIEMALAVK